MPTRASWIVDSFFVSTLPSMVAPEQVGLPEKTNGHDNTGLDMELELIKIAGYWCGRLWVLAI